MNKGQSQHQFFVAGGTVPPGSHSYVERSADRELFTALIAGEYCFVLNSRQMGKSSLAVRTVAKLNEAGVRTAFVDLTKVGGTNVNAEQWYAGLLVETGRVLNLRPQAMKYLREHVELGPAQRYLSFLQEVALQDGATPLVVLIDEIDATRSLSFSTDDLLAGIRQLHNGRALEPDLSRLVFCLLGAALPSDLIRDARMTPFNIGNRIELHDFTLEEAKPFAQALGPEGDAKLSRVLYWTGGHPYLTQAICSELGRSPDLTPDHVVRMTYLDGRARESDSNLSDVANRVLGKGDPSVGDRERANTLSMYERMLTNRKLSDDEANSDIGRIKMSGIARMESGTLKLRNRIYAVAFDRRWIRDSMPGQEIRRIKKAYWKGVIRTGMFASAIILAIGGLAWNNFRTMRAAQYDTYVATMRTIPHVLEQHDLSLIDSSLHRLREDPARGWEWDYWHRRTHRAVSHITSTKALSPMGRPPISPDGRLVALAHMDGSFDIAEIDGGRIVKSVNPRSFEGVCQGTVFSRDGKRIIVWTDQSYFREYDVETGKVVLERRFEKMILDAAPGSTLDKRFYLAFDDTGLVSLDIDNLTSKLLRKMPFGFYLMPCYSSDGTKLAWIEALHETNRLIVHDSANWKSIFETVLRSEAPVNPVWLPDGKRVVLANSGGSARVVDILSGREESLPDVASGEIWSMEASPDGRRLIAVSGTREVKLTPLVPQPSLRMKSIEDANRACFMPDGQRVAVCYMDFRLYDPNSDSDVPTIRVPGGIVPQISPDGLVWVGGKQPVVLDLTVPNPPHTRPIVDIGGGLISGHRNRNWYRLSRDENNMEVFDNRSNQVRLSVVSDPNVSFHELSPDGNLFVVGSHAHEVRFYKVGSQTPPVVVKLPSRISATEFSYDDKFLVTGDEYGNLAYWSRSDLRHPLWSICLNFGFPIQAIRISPDGKKLVVSRNDDRASVVDVESHHVTENLVGHSQTVETAEFSPDGRRIVTGSADHTVRIWDAQTGKELGIIGAHDASVASVSFLPGGRTIASASKDGVIKLWMTADQL